MIDHNSGSSRFFSRGGHRGGGQEHSSSRRSSRSPDRAFSYRRDHNTDKYSAPSSDESSHRSLPIEALRKKDYSNFDMPSNDSNRSSTMIDETNVSRSGHTNN